MAPATSSRNSSANLAFHFCLDEGGEGSTEQWLTVAERTAIIRLSQHRQLLLCCQEMKIHLHAVTVVSSICSDSMTMVKIQCVWVKAKLMCAAMHLQTLAIFSDDHFRRWVLSRYFAWMSLVVSTRNSVHGTMIRQHACHCAKNVITYRCQFCTIHMKLEVPKRVAIQEYSTAFFGHLCNNITYFIWICCFKLPINWTFRRLLSSPNYWSAPVLGEMHLHEHNLTYPRTQARGILLLTLTVQAHTI